MADGSHMLLTKPPAFIFDLSQEMFGDLLRWIRLPELNPDSPEAKDLLGLDESADRRSGVFDDFQPRP